MVARRRVREHSRDTSQPWNRRVAIDVLLGVQAPHVLHGLAAERLPRLRPVEPLERAVLELQIAQRYSIHDEPNGHRANTRYYIYGSSK